jgi:HEAT repeat protein
MTERYEPPSEFLKALIDDDAPLIGGEHAETNLRLLVEMTRDENPANRDWATLLLAQQDIDTPQLRDALLGAAEDESEYVRAEAILGLAQRDNALALPLLQRELSSAVVPLPLFEAAAIVAHPSLAADLRAFADPSGDDFLDGLAIEALRACEASA